MSWPTIPEDAIKYVRYIFRRANIAVAQQIANSPSIRETSLDDTLIASIIPYRAPRILDSGAVVQISVHNIGGLRQFKKWEIADIGIVVHVVQRGRIVARKIGLLQAKRLYPTNGDVEADDSVGFRFGINAFLNPEERPVSMLRESIYNFDENSRYSSLKSGSNQQQIIESFDERLRDAVFYLLYNPPDVPMSIKYPLREWNQIRASPRVGTRVYLKSTIHSVLEQIPRDSSPSFRQLQSATGAIDGWKLEFWAADLLLLCRAGKVYEKKDEDLIQSVVERRTGPIGAAIKLSIELPSD